MPTIVYYSGAPGAGKSTITKENVVLQPGLHLYIVPLVRSVTEVTEDLDRLRNTHNVPMTLHPFFADQTPAKASDCPELAAARRKGGSVRKRIVDRALQCRPDDHAAFIITHSSFMAIEPCVFAGWVLHIDEIPHSSVLSGTVYNPVLWQAYQGLYELQPIPNSKFSRLVLTPLATVAPIDVMNEPGFSDGDKTLFARVCSPTPVFIEAREYAHLGARRCRWYSAWSLAECRDFERVEIAASDLKDALMYRLNPVDVVEHPVEAKPSRAKIRLTYYDDGDQRGGLCRERAGAQQPSADRQAHRTPGRSRHLDLQQLVGRVPEAAARRAPPRRSSGQVVLRARNEAARLHRPALRGHQHAARADLLRDPVLVEGSGP